MRLEIRRGREAKRIHRAVLGALTHRCLRESAKQILSTCSLENSVSPEDGVRIQGDQKEF